MTALRARLGCALMIGAICYSLVHFMPDFPMLCRRLSAPHRWIELAGTDAVVAQLGGALTWLATLWLAVAVLLTVASAAGGRRGGAVERWSRRLAPAGLRRLVLTWASASLLLAPAAAAATTPSAQPPSTSAARSSAPAAVAGWPTGPASHGPGVLSWPVSGGPALSAPRTAPAQQPASGQPVAPPQHHARPQPAPVTVAPGDSLWMIAANRLGPQATDREIAVAWPYWYWTNRTVIGPDPHLIRPGLQLTVPAEQADGTIR